MCMYLLIYTYSCLHAYMCGKQWSAGSAHNAARWVRVNPLYLSFYT